MNDSFVILDRDGTLIEECHYLSHPEQVKLLPQAAAGLRMMREAGYGLIVVTNQSGIGRGYFDELQLHNVHERMMKEFEREGVWFDKIYHCPHLPKAECPCRKPKPGMILQAAIDFRFNPADCIVVGDKPCDVLLGKAVGATSFLVRTGYGASYEKNSFQQVDFVVDDLLEVALTVKKIRV